MNQITFADYQAANTGIAFFVFALGLAGAMLSGFWVLDTMRNTGPIRFVYALFAFVVGLVFYWFSAAWASQFFGLWKYEETADVPFAWPAGLVWLFVMVMAHLLSKLHQHVVGTKMRGLRKSSRRS